MKDNFYINSDYDSKDSENNLFNQEYIIVEISPYKINYFTFLVLEFVFKKLNVYILDRILHARKDKKN